jgi:alkylhydroperoxidase family enzyme
LKLGAEVVQAVYTEPATAPVSEQVKAALALIESFTLRPSQLRPEDLAVARRAGLTDQAIEDAFNVATLFNVIDRLADAFDFYVPDNDGLEHGARMLLRYGYRLPAFLWPNPR